MDYCWKHFVRISIQSKIVRGTEYQNLPGLSAFNSYFHQFGKCKYSFIFRFWTLHFKSTLCYLHIDRFVTVMCRVLLHTKRKPLPVFYTVFICSLTRLPLHFLFCGQTEDFGIIYKSMSISAYSSEIHFSMRIW